MNKVWLSGLRFMLQKDVNLSKINYKQGNQCFANKIFVILCFCPLSLIINQIPRGNNKTPKTCKDLYRFRVQKTKKIKKCVVVLYFY